MIWLFFDKRSFRKSEILVILLLFFSIACILFTQNSAFACNPEDNPKEDEQVVGDPVSLTSGKVYATFQDMTIPTRGALPLEVTRIYYGKRDYYGPFGRGWTFSYGMKVTRLASDIMELLSEQGKIEIYKWNGSLWAPPVGNYSTLIRNPDDSWTLSRKNGIIYNFGSFGRLTGIVDRNGNHINLTYNDDGFLTAVSDDCGRSLIFSYNSNNKISSITWPNNEITSYDYDANNNLAKITDPELNEINYTYNNYGTKTELASIIDARNNTTSYSYYEDSWDPNYLKCKRITYADGTHMDLVYNESLRFTLVTNERGYSTRYDYDPDENITVVTDPFNNETRSVYDPSFNKVYSIDALGHSIEYVYDNKGNCLEEHDPMGRKKIYTYEPNYSFIKTLADPKGVYENYCTTYYYDYEEAALGDLNGDGITTQTNGNVVKIVYPTVSAGIPIELFIYNQYGQVIQKTNANGIITKYEYYPDTGYLYREIDDYGNSSHINATTTFTYNALGNVLTTTDSLNRTTTFQYNKIGKLLKSISPQPFNYKVKYTYDGNGNTTKFEKQIDEDGLEWQTVENVYDGRDQLVTIKKYLPDNSFLTTTFHYDGAGNKDSETDANNNTTYYTYDETNRLIKTKDAENNETEYTYYNDGKLKTIKDPKSNVTTYQYDNSDWLVKTAYPDESFECYSPDLNSNISNKYTRNKNMIYYGYDNLNRLFYKQTDELYLYYYDKVGNLICVYKYVLGNYVLQTTNTYDNLNRLKTTTDNITNRTVSYEYNSLGLRTKLTYPDSTFITYEYNELNRLTHIKDQSGVSIASYTYYPDGKRKSLTYANGITTNYSYDDKENLEHITPDSEVLTNFSYSYDNVGNRLTKGLSSQGQGLSTETYSYDKIYQLKSVIANGNEANSSTYSYDSVGNRITQSGHNNLLTYTTNNLNQYTHLQKTNETVPIRGKVSSSITRVDVNGEETSIDPDRSFHKDVVLNPGQNTITASAYNTEGKRGEDVINITLDPTPINFIYDLNGNLTKKEVPASGGLTTTNYIYDYENRLTKVTNASSEIASFKYDYLGRRISKSVAMSHEPRAMSYVYDGDNLIAEYDSNGTLLNKYIYGSGIDELLSAMSYEPSAKYYFHSDALGSIIDITDNTGSLVEHYEYDVFGSFKIFSMSHEPRAMSLIGNSFYFTGREWDSEINLYYYRARFYDPKLGKFLQTDPMGYAAGINLYLYCQNNVINLIDPLGLWEVNTRSLGNDTIAWVSENVVYNGTRESGRHWQMFYDDGTNIGYMGDDKEKSRPVFKSDDESLYEKDSIISGKNDDLMKEAEQIARKYWENEYKKGQKYHHPILDNKRKFDCQEFIWKMIEEYNALLKKEVKKTCPKR